MKNSLAAMTNFMVKMKSSCDDDQRCLVKLLQNKSSASSSQGPSKLRGHNFMAYFTIHKTSLAISSPIPTSFWQSL